MMGQRTRGAGNAYTTKCSAADEKGLIWYVFFHIQISVGRATMYCRPLHYLLGFVIIQWASSGVMADLSACADSQLLSDPGILQLCETLAYVQKGKLLFYISQHRILQESTQTGCCNDSVRY